MSSFSPDGISGATAPSPMAASSLLRAGLDRDGLLLKIMLSGGLYRYDAQNLQARRRRRVADKQCRLADQAWLCRIQGVYGAEIQIH